MAGDAADDILRQMRRTRREISAGAEDIAEKARDMADWKSYVRAHPWLCLGAAATLGYLLVPPKVHISTASFEPVLKALRETQQLVQSSASAAPPEPKRSGMLGSIVSSLAGSLLRSGMGLVTEQVSRYVQSQMHPNGHANSPDDRVQYR